jgi:predicted nucleic acid-binding protein
VESSGVKGGGRARRFFDAEALRRGGNAGHIGRSLRSHGGPGQASRQGCSALDALRWRRGIRRSEFQPEHRRNNLWRERLKPTWIRPRRSRFATAPILTTHSSGASFPDPPPLATSALVVAEGHGWFLRRYDAIRAIQFLNFIGVLPIKVLPFDDAELVKSAKPIKKFSDRTLTLADAHGLAVMQDRRNRVCWSTDRHLQLTGVPLVI